MGSATRSATWAVEPSADWLTSGYPLDAARDDTARAGVGPALDREVPELARFAQARRPAIGVHGCNGIALPARG